MVAASMWPQEPVELLLFKMIPPPDVDATGRPVPDAPVYLTMEPGTAATQRFIERQKALGWDFEVIGERPPAKRKRDHGIW